VREGDTIEFIAELFGVDIDDLLQINGLTENNDIFEGDILVIPGQVRDDEDEGAVPDGVSAPVP
jgi:LysM repeat protein